MRRGQPVIVHANGTSLWVLTRHANFAKGVIGLAGNKSHSVIVDNTKIKRLVPGFRATTPYALGPGRSSIGSTPTGPSKP